MLRGQNANIYGSSLKTDDLCALGHLIENMDAFFATYPDAQNTSFAIEHFLKAGGQALPPDATAYPHRDITGDMLFTFQYDDQALDDAIDAFTREQDALLQRGDGFAGLQVYVNYAHGDEGPAPLYTKRNLGRLRGLKGRWDPHGLFSVDAPFA